MKKFWLGFSYPLVGAKLIFSSKTLFLLAIIPFIIELIIFATIIGSVGPFVSSLVASAIAYIFPSASGFLYGLFYYPILILFWLVFIVSITGGIYLIASVISSPFNGLLAERVLMQKGVLKDIPFSFSDFISNSLRMLFTSILRSTLLILVGLALLVCSFIPGLNILAAMMTFVILAFDASDYSLEARRFSLKQRLRYLGQQKSVYLGMGAAVGLISLIPGLLLLLMPWLVAGFAGITDKLENLSHDSR